VEAGFGPEALSEDGFLGGRLRIRQPKAGFRSGLDAVFLAAACPARPGETVLELGCGAGAAGLCLMARAAGVLVTGVEVQPAYAALARANAAANGLSMEVAEGDLARLAGVVAARTFGHVIANPPYLRAGGGTPARDPGRETALRDTVPLADWVAAGMRRLRPGGTFTLIQDAARLPDLLSALPRTGVTVLPLLPRAGRDAVRVIVQARKGGRAAFRLLSPFVLHAGAGHARDADDFTPEARAILRDGAALPVA
jgi:tRNA1(Val) A37 N6-methylase TrmN6